MVATIVHQLTRNLTEKQIREGGFSAYFVNHGNGVYPCNADGSAFSAQALQVSGDPITDIHEDLAAEQKARSTYDNILRMTDDPDVLNAIRFLREREVVHYQRFGEGLRIVTDSLDDRNFYAFNPAFDKMPAKKATPKQTAPTQATSPQTSGKAAGTAQSPSTPAKSTAPLMTAVQSGKPSQSSTARNLIPFCSIAAK